MKYTLLSLLPLLLSFMVLSCDRNIPGDQGPEDQGGISGDTVDFSITLTDTTSTGVTGTIIPSDSLMTYLAMIVEQESVSGLTDEEWFESDIAWMTQMAATFNTTLHDYIETFRLLRGETFVEEDNLQPGTDYYLYAYGLDNSGTAPAMTTPITKAPFTTTVPEPSDEGITIQKFCQAEGVCFGYLSPSDYRAAARLGRSVGIRLRADHRKAGAVSVGMRTGNFENSSRQMQLDSATDVTEELYQTACTLLMRMWDGHRPLRLLNVTATRLTEEEYRQYSLFDRVNYEKLEKANRAMDSIRSRFGEDAVMRASFLKSTVSPTGGGLNREKRREQISRKNRPAEEEKGKEKSEDG